jgi:ribosomal protein S18 acetylase RimI-like enzyme
MLVVGSRVFASVFFKQIAWGSAEYRKTLEICDLVLRRPHWQSIAGDNLQPERSVDLYAAFSGIEVIGTAYLTSKLPDTMQLKQLAIHPSFQRHRIGSEFVRFLENEARKTDAAKVYLEARVVVRAFYENARYETISEQFLYRGIPHLQMQKAPMPQ